MTDSLSLLAGFVFAHAAWSVSDLSEGELLAPLAILEKSGQREIFRFEAETQEQAIFEGKVMLSTRERDVDAWAFAREGQMQERERYVDVLSVEAKTSDMLESIVFVQRFQPFSKGKFLLLGDPLVSIGGKAVSEIEEVELTLFHGHLIVVKQGVQDAPSQSAIPSAISPADDRFSSHWAQAQRASA